MADQSREQLLADLKSTRGASDFSDLAITCGDDKYLAHKVIVCSRSSVFAKAVKFPGKEAEENKIDLSDNEGPIVKLLLQYMYEAEYDPVLPSVDQVSNDDIRARNGPHSCEKNDQNGDSCFNYSSRPYRQICPHHLCGVHCNVNCSNFLCDECLLIVGDAGQLLVHAKMYEVADKYDVTGLKQLCIEKYKLACNKFWNDAKFPESAHYVYCTTPSRDKGLRNIVCKTLSDHMSLLEKPEVEDLMTEFNGLAFGLLFDKAKQSGWCNK